MLTLALNALEPIAPLGAQVLWILQPTAGLIGGKGVRSAVADFAQALETPDGIASLRAELAQGEHDEQNETPHQHETEV